MPDSQLGPEEVERMRNLVLDHDQNHPVDNTFDPNRPQIVPSPNLAYPKMLYHKDGRIEVAKNAEHEQKLTKSGFGLSPHPKYDYSVIKQGRALSHRQSFAERHRKPAIAEPVDDSPSDDFAGEEEDGKE